MLVKAKQQGLVKAVLPLVDRLVREISFRVSGDLLEAVLRMAGETPRR